MSQLRFARLALMLAALGLNAAPALMHSASAQNKDAAAAPAAAPADTVRPELYKLLDPAQIKPLMDAKNYTEVQSRLTQAEAVANRTPYETYILNRTKLTLATATRDEKMLQSSLEAIIASGKLSATDQPRFTKALADTYYSSKNYAKAIELYKGIQATGTDKDNVDAALIRSYYFNNDFPQVVTLLGPQLEAQVKAGKTPTMEDLRLYGSAAVKAKDNAAYQKSLEMFVSYYPSDDYWADLIKRAVFQKPGFNEANYADVLRLQYAASKAMPPENYNDLAELALKDGFPAEAKKVVDAGFASGALSTAAHKQLRDRATKQAADDVKSIASSEAGAAKGKGGAGLVNLGWEYVNMDQFDKGIGFIEQGIAKGGLKSADEAKLRLGIAYARAGNKDKALQTFESVKAGGGLSDMARLWVLLLNHPNTGAGAAAK